MDGDRATCALSNRGQVTCWGSNTWGMLGTGDTTNRGDKLGQLGAALPPLDFGAGLRPRAITARADYSCALLSNQRTKCWGNNDGAQLGTGDHNSRGDDPGELGDALPEVGLVSSAKMTGVGVGHYHSCAVIDGHVACWGINDVDQNGYGDHLARETTTDLATLPMIDLGANVIVQSVAILFNSTCVFTSDARVKCWGYNPNGELGLSDTQSRGGFAGEMGSALPFVDVGAGPITQLASGYGHVCVVIDQRVKCWGDNSRGALGVGDTTSRGGGARIRWVARCRSSISDPTHASPRSPQEATSRAYSSIPVR